MFAEQFQERSTVHWLKQDVDDKMDIRCPLYQANLFGSKHHPHHHPWSGGEGGGDVEGLLGCSCLSQNGLLHLPCDPV